MKPSYFLLPILILMMCCSSPADPLIRGVRGGKIKGTLLEDSEVYSFKGIPFAASPVGDLRWKAPQPVKAWDGIMECTQFGASPMQADPNPFMFWSEEFLIPKSPIGEDCLYLNVWTKAESAKAEKRPVLVYIYGGGFQSGGSGCPIYDGRAMAEKDIVFLSFNYRVGLFGFFAHPELTAESEHKASGNYALMDMIAALKWVQENIENFGGDPNNVTIAGQSAGAFAVNYLVASDKAKGLFHKALAQSGGNFYTRPDRPLSNLEAAEKQGLAFADSLNCKNLKELRNKSAKEIFEGNTLQIGPIIDGYIVSAPVYETFEQGAQNDVTTIVGWNKDDIIFVQPMAAASFPTAMEAQFDTYAPAFLEAYPHKDDATTFQSQKDMNRDEIFGSQGYAWAKMQKQSGEKNIYVYNFNRALPAHNPETQFGAFHSGEIVYWYDNLSTLNRPWEAVDQQIADQMSAYLVNFLNTGNPNGAGLTEWPAFDNKTEKVLSLDTKIKAETLPDKKQLMAWEQFYLQDLD